MDHETSKKGFQLLGGGALPPRPLTRSSTALPPDPCYRLALPRSPYLGAPLKFVLAPHGVKFWRRRWFCWVGPDFYARPSLCVGELAPQRIA